MNMYVVRTKCGHVGRNYFTVKDFAVCAETAKEAAEKARMFPRVKHDQKDAITFVNKVDMDEYINVKEDNDNDPYFHCKCIQEQKRACSNLVICREEDEFDMHKDEEYAGKPIYYGKERLRNPKKYYNRYLGGVDYEGITA